MTNGFQGAVTSEKHLHDKALLGQDQMKLPVVGYTGHRRGNRAQNFYGKNYRDCAI